MNTPPIPSSEEHLPDPEEVKELKAHVKRMAKLLDEFGVVMIPPPHYESNDWDGQDYFDLILDADVFKTIRKVLKLGVKVQSPVDYLKIWDFFNLMEEIESEYFDADSGFRYSFQCLKENGDFSRLPKAEERRDYVQWLYDYVLSGSGFIDDDELLKIAKAHNGEYLTKQGAFTSPPRLTSTQHLISSTSSQQKSGCLGVVLVALLPVSLLLILL